MQEYVGCDVLVSFPQGVKVELTILEFATIRKEMWVRIRHAEELGSYWRRADFEILDVISESS